MSFFNTQNPGIGGLDELTLAEEVAVQTIAGLGTAGYFLRTNLAGTAVEWVAAAGGGSVSDFSIVDANGLSGSVANSTSTPALTLVRKYRSIAGVTTLASTDGIVRCTGTTYTVTLMTAVGISGRQLSIKNSASGNITIDGNASETIDGSTTAVITPNTSLTIVSDGTNWFII